ncbi:MAG: helix-turn-helix domain-containing protein [Chloroflexales bacterium]|nr:helix-turn-helix domain-containing protein [Chloroflexales bacterium]
MDHEALQDDSAIIYLSLSAASKLLGVHSATLRRWADTGAIPVYVTPGGHRRFARSDIEALAARKPLSTQALTSTWARKALEQTRTELAQASQRPSWLANLDNEARDKWRRIGQQLMGVVLRYVNMPEEDVALLEEARAIGQAYARNARQVGMPLTAAIEAALFFRDSLVEAAMDLPEESKMRPEASARLLRRISQVVNVVQLAVAAGYENNGL